MGQFTLNEDDSDPDEEDFGPVEGLDDTSEESASESDSGELP